MNVLGIDPGAKRTGYFLYDTKAGRTRAYGVARQIEEVEQLLADADVVVIERPYAKRLYNRRLVKELGEVEAARRLLSFAHMQLTYALIREAAKKQGSMIIEYYGYGQNGDRNTWQQVLTDRKRPSRHEVQSSINHFIPLRGQGSEHVLDAAGLVATYLKETGIAAKAA